MDTISALNERWEKIKAWHQTEEYRLICEKYLKQCQCLAAKGLDLMDDISNIRSKAEQETVVVKSAVGGDIHRGAYCPSPIYDIVVGNAHRGKILKRVTPKSKITHRFGFSSGGQLLYAESLFDDDVTYTEYILDQGDTKYGITIGLDMQIAAFCEENYQSGNLTSYALVKILPRGNAVNCVEYYCEKYHYDELGLKICERHRYNTLTGSFMNICYEFERQNENLVSYIIRDLSLPKELQDVYSECKYSIGRRKS